MASLASEIEKLADLKAKGVLTEDEFTHAKAAVIAGDDADSFEEAGADADAIPVKSGIGYMTFWSEAFTLTSVRKSNVAAHLQSWPPRHRRDTCSTAWRCGSRAARFGRHGHPTHWLICTQECRGACPI